MPSERHKSRVPFGSALDDTHTSIELRPSQCPIDVDAQLLSVLHLPHAGLGGALALSQPPEHALDGWDWGDLRNRNASHVTDRVKQRGALAIALSVIPAIATPQQIQAAQQITASDFFPARHDPSSRLTRTYNDVITEPPVYANWHGFSHHTAAIVEHLMKDSSGGVGARDRYRDGKGVVRTREVLMRLSIKEIEIFVDGVADDDIVRRHDTSRYFRMRSELSSDLPDTRDQRVLNCSCRSVLF